MHCNNGIYCSADSLIGGKLLCSLTEQIMYRAL